MSLPSLMNADTRRRILAAVASTCEVGWGVAWSRERGAEALLFASFNGWDAPLWRTSARGWFARAARSRLALNASVVRAVETDNE